MGLFDAEDKFLEHVLDRQKKVQEGNTQLVQVSNELMLANGKKQGRFEVASKVKFLLETGRTAEAQEYVNGVFNAGGDLPEK